MGVGEKTDKKKNDKIISKKTNSPQKIEKTTLRKNDSN